MSLTATVSDITRCSLHDGPGIRTVIYFKGCGLRCKWCHNPETLQKNKQLVHYASKCIGCGRCVTLCPVHHVVQDGKLHLVREGCTACGRCSQLCPTGALKLIGEEKSIDELLEVIVKDKHFYDKSGGGVTFSGGECLLQPDFIAQLAKKCKQEGIHTAVESAFFVPWESVEKILPYIDLFFADLKIPDPEKHRTYTGQNNTRILENITRLTQTQKNVIIRIPVIPTVNDSDTDLEQFTEILNSLDKTALRVELLKYNHLSESKYQILEQPYTKFFDAPQTDEFMRSYCEYLNAKTKLPCTF
ncbi:MAG: glycyl-radical enzyme activating protein [Clostridia bacterium]|nr:glycyl-radical enzyme activating protein [Clostridia bacterium]